MHRARVLRRGTDCTVVAYGPSVKTALAAAAAAEEDGYSVQVVDLRSLSPLDVETRCAPAAVATGRVVVVHEASTFLGLGAEIAATITEECFYALEAPVLRVRRVRPAVPTQSGRARFPARPRSGAGRGRADPQVLVLGQATSARLMRTTSARVPEPAARPNGAR